MTLPTEILLPIIECLSPIGLSKLAADAKLKEPLVACGFPASEFTLGVVSKLDWAMSCSELFQAIEDGINLCNTNRGAGIDQLIENRSFAAIVWLRRWCKRERIYVSINFSHVRLMVEHECLVALDWLVGPLACHEIEYAARIAAENGKLSVLKWLEAERLWFKIEDVVHYAAYNDQLEVIEWVREIYPWMWPCSPMPISKRRTPRVFGWVHARYPDMLVW